MKQRIFLNKSNAPCATTQQTPESNSWPYDTHFKHESVTAAQYGAFDQAKGYFIKTPFEKPLPPILLTLHEHRGSGGYYSPRRWVAREGEYRTYLIAQINISPSILLLEPKMLMSVLVHELVHHEQYTYGKPGRGGYHNTEFATLMHAIGLISSSTGQPGARRTGDRMSHYILEGGLFEEAYNAMPKEYILPFKPHVELRGGHVPNRLSQIQKDARNKNKTKYTCLGCGTAAWGKPHLNVICGQCNTRLVIIGDIK